MMYRKIVWYYYSFILVLEYYDDKSKHTLVKLTKTAWLLGKCIHSYNVSISWLAKYQHFSQNVSSINS